MTDLEFRRACAYYYPYGGCAYPECSADCKGRKSVDWTTNIINLLREREAAARRNLEIAHDTIRSAGLMK